MVALNENKNLLFLWVEGLIVGATLTLKDGNKKTIKRVLDYDSITHVFKIEFEDGDIQLLSDKDRYYVELPEDKNDIVKKPTSKRKIFKRW